MSQMLSRILKNSMTAGLHSISIVKSGHDNRYIYNITLCGIMVRKYLKQQLHHSIMHHRGSYRLQLPIKIS